MEQLYLWLSDSSQTKGGYELFQAAPVGSGQLWPAPGSSRRHLAAPDSSGQLLAGSGGSEQLRAVLSSSGRTVVGLWWLCCGVVVAQW